MDAEQPSPAEGLRRGLLRQERRVARVAAFLWAKPAYLPVRSPTHGVSIPGGCGCEAAQGSGAGKPRAAERGAGRAGQEPLRRPRGRSRGRRHVSFFVNRSHLHTTISIHKKKNNKKKLAVTTADLRQNLPCRMPKAAAPVLRTSLQPAAGGGRSSGPAVLICAVRCLLTQLCGKYQLGEVLGARDQLHS